MLVCWPGIGVPIRRAGGFLVCRGESGRRETSLLELFCSEVPVTMTVTVLAAPFIARALTTGPRSGPAVAALGRWQSRCRGTSPGPAGAAPDSVGACSVGTSLERRRRRAPNSDAPHTPSTGPHDSSGGLSVRTGLVVPLTVWWRTAQRRTLLLLGPVLVVSGSASAVRCCAVMWSLLTRRDHSA